MKPSAAEMASAMSFDPLLYPGFWLVVLGAAVVSGGVGVVGIGVDGTVEFTLVPGVLTGGDGACPSGRSPSRHLVIQRDISDFHYVASPWLKKTILHKEIANGEFPAPSYTCAGAGVGGEIEPAEGRQQHGAGHVHGDRGPAGAGLAERLAEAQRLVVHHTPQVGAARVGRRGGGAVEEVEAGEEA